MNRNREFLIHFEGLIKYYGHREVIHIADLKLYIGDKLLIIGSNGSGKSTFLRLIAGISVATTGYVERSRLDKLVIAYAPQDGGVYGDMSLQENLMIVRRLYRRSGAALADQLFLEQTGMVNYLDEPINNLSGGFRRLATIACALAAEPQVLFLDEPTSNLDVKHAQLVQDAILTLCDKLSFVAVSSHDSRGFEFFNRRVVLSKGEMQ